MNRYAKWYVPLEIDPETQDYCPDCLGEGHIREWGTIEDGQMWIEAYCERCRGKGWIARNERDAECVSALDVSALALTEALSL